MSDNVLYHSLYWLASRRCFGATVFPIKVATGVLPRPPLGSTLRMPDDQFHLSIIRPGGISSAPLGLPLSRGEPCENRRSSNRETAPSIGPNGLLLIQ